MWLSPKATVLLYDIGNIGLIIGLVFGVISTVLVVWTGNVKEDYLKRELAQSRERTTSLETELAKAKTAISEANARAAGANEKAESERLARIRLEEDLAWRRLSNEQQQIIASQVSKFSGQIVSLWYGQGDKEWTAPFRLDR